MESIYHKDRNMFRLLNKVKSCSAEIVLGWVTKYEYPLLQFFFLFFSPSFSKAILRRAELPSLCNVVFPIYQLFVPHFAMAVLCVYRDRSLEFSSILSTVDLSKHLIMVESFENSYSLSIL